MLMEVLEGVKTQAGVTTLGALVEAISPDSGCAAAF